MNRPEINWDDTDVFATGTTGPSGRRVFYLQAQRAGDLVSLKLEKQQVAGLAEFLHRMLDDLPPVEQPKTDPTSLAASFTEPGEPAWVIGSLGVTYQQSTDRLVLFVEELIRDEDTEPAQARFPLSRHQVAAFVEQARKLVTEGRPPCPLCHEPLEATNDGWCPCVN
ncbi:MAG: DUF3090 family protein [Actinobacteria bacterium]|jgi:uncharacterized repeat protein (TIGR03847 family)|nr:DUF3090 family protein [Actinomycetota bacterium]MBT3969822.1 DUF3090 family protein [Actinomycetota bacterium]MBT4304065.1 DUF3090 family protein [Actinomycetota bacterium]MBT4477653.1 DUF3090 family protein [Actinomycetota bacterium]MBT5118373.1 DUF3090 family protein [Actinomycetota bacterium]